MKLKKIDFQYININNISCHKQLNKRILKLNF